MSSLKELNSLWKIWTLFPPRLVLAGLFTFLTVLALGIHFILLSTPRFNWIAGVTGAPAYSHFLPPAVK